MQIALTASGRSSNSGANMSTHTSTNETAHLCCVIVGHEDVPPVCVSLPLTATVHDLQHALDAHLVPLLAPPDGAQLRLFLAKTIVVPSADAATTVADERWLQEPDPEVTALQATLDHPTSAEYTERCAFLAPARELQPEHMLHNALALVGASHIDSFDVHVLVALPDEPALQSRDNSAGVTATLNNNSMAVDDTNDNDMDVADADIDVAALPRTDDPHFLHCLQFVATPNCRLVALDAAHVDDEVIRNLLYDLVFCYYAWHSVRSGVHLHWRYLDIVVTAVCKLIGAPLQTCVVIPSAELCLRATFDFAFETRDAFVGVVFAAPNSETAMHSAQLQSWLGAEVVRARESAVAIAAANAGQRYNQRRILGIVTDWTQWFLLEYVGNEIVAHETAAELICDKDHREHTRVELRHIVGLIVQHSRGIMQSQPHL